jgi:hypothetical protein
MKNLLTKLLMPIVMVAALAMPNSADAQESINPFWPSSETTLYYGSGDINGDGLVNIDDYNEMVALRDGESSTPNDRADIDGDGAPATTGDLEILGEFLDGGRSYLPSNWKALQATEERDDWFQKTFIIDPTSEQDYIPGEFTSWRFGQKTHGNFYGIPDTTNIPFEYIDNQRFNMPLFYAQISPLGGGTEGHGINATLTGENPLNWNDWNFGESQTNETNVQIGGWNIPYNSAVGIYKTEGFNEDGGAINTLLVGFRTNQEGEEPTLFTDNPNYPNGHNPDLMLTRPTVGIKEPKETPEIVNDYKLSQNYPNPFNSSTTIRYSLDNPDNVSLNVYDIRGNHVKTLIDNISQQSGNHEFNFNANNLSSGIYLYNLKTESGIYKTGKMTLVK